MMRFVSLVIPRGGQIIEYVATIQIESLKSLSRGGKTVFLVGINLKVTYIKYYFHENCVRNVKQAIFYYLQIIN